MIKESEENKLPAPFPGEDRVLSHISLQTTVKQCNKFLQPGTNNNINVTCET